MSGWFKRLELLDELARVEHAIEALGEYRRQLRERVTEARREG